MDGAIAAFVAIWAIFIVIAVKFKDDEWWDYWTTEEFDEYLEWKKHKLGGNKPEAFQSQTNQRINK